MSDSENFTIQQVAGKLGRSPQTIRTWMGREDFPENLRPSRVGGRNTLMWSEAQIPGLEDYARTRESARGWSAYHQNRKDA